MGWQVKINITAIGLTGIVGNEAFYVWVLTAVEYFKSCNQFRVNGSVPSSPESLAYLCAQAHCS